MKWIEQKPVCFSCDDGLVKFWDEYKSEVTAVTVLKMRSGRPSDHKMAYKESTHRCTQYAVTSRHLSEQPNMREHRACFAPTIIWWPLATDSKKKLRFGVESISRGFGIGSRTPLRSKLWRLRQDVQISDERRTIYTQCTVFALLQFNLHHQRIYIRIKNVSSFTWIEVCDLINFIHLLVWIFFHV